MAASTTALKSLLVWDPFAMASKIKEAVLDFEPFLELTYRVAVGSSDLGCCSIFTCQDSTIGATRTTTWIHTES